MEDENKLITGTEIDPETELQQNNKPEVTEDVNTSTQSNTDSDTPMTTKKSKFKLPKIDFRNRNTILAIALSSALLIIGLTTFILMKDKNATVSSEDAVVVQEDSEQIQIGAAITLQEGTLQIQKDGNWEDVAKDQVLEEGNTLRTVGATSRAIITFDDGSALRLDANSEAELSQLTTNRIQIKHVSGYTYNRVIPSENLKYVVYSNDAQYEAQGTAFVTIATGDEQSVEVFHSSVLETSTNKIPKEGEKLTVLNKANPSEDGKITKIDIEEVKNDPFMQWNIEQDIKDENYKKSLGFLGDVTAPEITLNSKDGDVILLEPNATEGTIEISGSTESGAKVTVLSKSQPGATPVDVTVGTDGKFTTPVLSAPIGDSVFEFVAKDKTGNKTTKTLRIKFQKKSQPVAGNAVSFVLSGTANNTLNKVELSWKLTGVESPDGVKIVFSKATDPTYANPMPSGVGYEYAPDGISTKIPYDSLKKLSGSGKYYIKACIYDKNSGTCGQYSNPVSVDIP